MADAVAGQWRADAGRWAGLSLERPRIMGVVNVTPDSFSDGGRYFDAGAAIAAGLAMADAGADIVDVGGESTRPGSPPTAPDEESQTPETLAELTQRCQRWPHASSVCDDVLRAVDPTGPTLA